MPSTVNALVSRAQRRIQRTLNLPQARVAAVQMSPLQSGDRQERTTADDTGRRDRMGRRLASVLLSPFEQGRIERYREYREMVEESPELARAHEVRSDFCFGGPGEGRGDEPLSIGFADDARPALRQVVEDVAARLDLQRLVPQVHREGMWLGDSFLEAGVVGGSPMSILNTRDHQPERVRVMEVGGRVHHYQVAPRHSIHGCGGSGSWRNAEPKAPWQILHYRHRPSKGSLYGRSMFHSGRKARRVMELLDDVAAMIAVRRAAGDQYFMWPVPPDMDEQKLADLIREAQMGVERESVFDTSGNLRQRAAAWLDTLPRIMPFRVINGIDTKPEVVEARPVDLSTFVPLMEHQQRRLNVVHGVPQAFIGLERDVNARATLGQQGLAFALTIRRDQSQAAGFTVDALNLALALAGMVPEPGEYTVSLPRPSQFDEALRSEVFERRARGVGALVTSGLPLPLAMRQGFDLSEDDLEDLQAEVAAGRPVDEALREAARQAMDAAWEPVQVDGAERPAGDAREGGG